MTARDGRAARSVRPVPAAGAAELVGATDWPCISILLSTEPADVMRLADAERLHALAADVEQQLVDRAVPGAQRLLGALARLVNRAVAEPTDQGLALYVNPEVSRCYRLPVPVASRSAVERSFATRVLLTSLRRTPPYALLVLHARRAELYRGGTGTLWQVGARAMVGEPGGDDFLVDVDRWLGGHRSQHPGPLVLGGDPLVVERFCDVSRHLERMAGRVPSTVGPDLGALETAASGEVDRYLRSRRDEALQLFWVALATRPADVARGVHQCWEALHRGRPGMLLVEADFVHPRAGQPVRSSGQAPVVEGSPADEERDLVDDLLEVAVLRGGQVAVVEHGDLAAHGRIVHIGPPGPTRGPRPRR